MHPTLDQERREVMEAVREALAARNRTPEREAACFHLLEHLAGIPSLHWATIASSVNRSRYVS